MYYYIEPEVSGGLGDRAIVDNSVHPPIVSKLHYQLDGWLDNDILETFPCYIITERLKRNIESESLSGYTLDEVEISKSDHFLELYKNKEIPKFYWLKVTANAGKEDFGIASDHRLVISEKALSIFKAGNIDQADIEGFHP